jgi:hypothetical protein
MKFIKYSLLALVAFTFASCLKPKNDFAGLREDEGQIVTSVTETQYINTDAQNIGFGFYIYNNFSFNTLPNESVKFFTLHISQPREKKMSGSMTVKFTVSPSDHGLPLPPAGAIQVADVVVPASGANSFDYPVKFTVNKTLLDPAQHYGIKFTIASVSQGVASLGDNSVDVIINEDPADLLGAWAAAGTFNTSKITGLYTVTTTVVDSAKAYGVTNNTKQMYLAENGVNNIEELDLYLYAFGNAARQSVTAANLTTGAITGLIRVRYVIDATGKVIDVKDASTGLTLNPVFDPSSPNAFVYTSNDQRTLNVKYTIRLTIASLNRPFTITESAKYSFLQAMY